MKNLFTLLPAILLSQLIIAQPCMTLTTSSVQASCSTCNDGTATVTATGGTPAYSYLWNTNPAQTSSTAIGLKNGHWYTVTVTDGIGCTENDYIFVCDTTSVPSFTYVVYGQDSVVFTNTSAGNGNYSLSLGGLGGFLSNWVSGANYTNTNGTPGTYNVCIYDTLSCSWSFCDSVEITACNMTTTITGNPVSCYDAADGSISVSLMGGTGPFTYLWNSGATGSTISNLSAGMYTVTITDSSGCNTSATYTVSEPNALTLDMTALQASCNTCTDGSATVFVSGGITPYIYSWNTNPVQTTSTATGLKNGNWYTVYVTDNNSCTESNYIYVCDTNSSPSFTYVVYSQDSVVFTNTSAGTGKYDLSLGDGSYMPDWALGNNLSHVYIASGTYTVCISDTLSCAVVFCDTVVINATSVVKEHSKSILNIYPNPTKGILTIEGAEGLIEIYDLYGRLVTSTQANTLDISQAALGIYFVRVVSERGWVFTQKIVKD